MEIITRAFSTEEDGESVLFKLNISSELIEVIRKRTAIADMAKALDGRFSCLEFFEGWGTWITAEQCDANYYDELDVEWTEFDPEEEHVFPNDSNLRTDLNTMEVGAKWGVGNHDIVFVAKLKNAWPEVEYRTPPIDMKFLDDPQCGGCPASRHALSCLRGRRRTHEVRLRRDQ